MARKSQNRKDREESVKFVKQEITLLKQQEGLTKDIAKNISSYLRSRKKSAQIGDQISKQITYENQLREAIKKHIESGDKRLGSMLETEADILSIDTKQLKLQQKQLQSLSLSRSVLGSTLGLIQEASGVNLKQEMSMKNVLLYLVEQQKSLKQLNLQFGISGQKSKILQESISNTTFEVQILGKGLKDITEMMTSFADESGRARLMTESSMKSISEIAAGTALSNVEAGRLVAKYSEMGINAIGVNKEITNILDTSERMGLNADRILKSMSDNFAALSRFHFKRGVKGLSELVVFSTKFKQDISDTLNAMEKGRYLDSVIEMSAQLRLAGGSAAAVADPFKLLFAARNSPKQFAEMVKDMTSDIAMLNKEGEFQILASGFDRLKIISEATSIPVEKLAEQARRTAQISIMQKSIPGFIRANKEYKDLIEGQSQWNQKLKQFEIVDPFNPSRAIDIRKITEQELKSFKSGGESLIQRAKDAQGFDDAFRNLSNTIKSAFLPLITGLNKVTGWIQSATEGVKGLGTGLVAFGAIAIPLFMSFGGTVLGSLLSLGKMNIQMGIMGKSMGKFASFSKGLPKGGLLGSLFGGISGMGMIQGAAAIGILSGSMFVFGKALQLFEGISWETLGKAGVAILGLTGSIIGLGAIMSSGIGTIAILAGSAALGIMGASLIPLAISLEKIGNADVSNIGDGFMKIGSSITALDTNKLQKLKDTADSLHRLNTTTGVFGELKQLFGDGLKVKFDENKVALNIDLTSTIDGNVLSRNIAQKVVTVTTEDEHYKTA